jgi:2-methylisoborneol synthase
MGSRSARLDDANTAGFHCQWETSRRTEAPVSLLSRLSAPAAADDLASVAAAVLATLDGAAPSMLPGLAPPPAADALPPPVVPRLPFGPTGLGTSAVRVLERPASDESPLSGLYCPGAVRDNAPLGDEVNDRLVTWAEKVGIYPGQLDKLHATNFGRLMMLAHPECDDPDRLLAAGRCALAEWAVDDHYVDGEADETEPEQLGRKLAIAYAVIDPAHLPRDYVPPFEEVVRNDPVTVALRSSLGNLGRYATATQVARLRHELCVMCLAYNQEAVWRTTGRRPPVWEYLMHRHENSFIPCMVLIDPVAGYELPPMEFANQRVRRAFTLAGTASVLVNDLYSMAKEDPTDTNLPRVIAAEENCSLPEAIDRSVEIHNELMHAFEDEAAALALVGSPMLRRFLACVWAWLGGSRQWHSETTRYRDDSAKEGSAS